MIGDDIEITVVDIRGDRVRLGITAPADVLVHRREVWEAIRANAEPKLPSRLEQFEMLARQLLDSRGRHHGEEFRLALEGMGKLIGEE